MFRPSCRFIGMIGLSVLMAMMIGYGLQGTGAQDAPSTGHHGSQTDDNSATPEASAGSPYANAYDPNAPIRALSPEDIEQIRQGGGARFALPAELNGLPGPRHVLDLADDLTLTSDQQQRIQAIYDQFRAEAVPAGERYLAAAQALEEGFRAQTITAANLPGHVAGVSRLEGELVTIHLRAHLQTAEILTAEQIATYNQLRGYR